MTLNNAKTAAWRWRMNKGENDIKRWRNNSTWQQTGKSGGRRCRILSLLKVFQIIRIPWKKVAPLLQHPWSVWQCDVVQHAGILWQSWPSTTIKGFPRACVVSICWTSGPISFVWFDGHDFAAFFSHGWWLNAILIICPITCVAHTASFLRAYWCTAVPTYQCVNSDSQKCLRRDADIGDLINWSYLLVNLVWFG